MMGGGIARWVLAAIPLVTAIRYNATMDPWNINKNQREEKLYL
jgi:hypothetical protein